MKIVPTRINTQISEPTTPPNLKDNDINSNGTKATRHIVEPKIIKPILAIHDQNPMIIFSKLGFKNVILEQKSILFCMFVFI